MTRRALIIALMTASAFLITACSAGRGAATPPAGIASAEPAATPVAPVETPTQKPGLSFDPILFRDQFAGILLSYPSNWSVISRELQGERGAQSALLSPGSNLNQAAEGGTRVFLSHYQWEPKRDLEAYIAQRKLAWEESEFQVKDEEEFSLTDGRRVVIFTVATPDRGEVLNAFMVAGEDYLEISADGDLNLGMEIIHTVEVLK